MIGPVFHLLQQLASSVRSGLLLLVMTGSDGAPYIVSLWLREGRMVHASGHGREGPAALLLLRHARCMHRWQWFDMDLPAGHPEHELPPLAEFLEHERMPGLVVPTDDVSMAMDEWRMDRLFAIQCFLQAMGGASGEDTFMQILLDHPPLNAWDELADAFREHIGRYYGARVARQVVDA